MERADQEPASARGQGAAGALASGQAHRGECHSAGHGARFRRVADLALHHHAGGGGATVAGDARFPVAVLSQHGNRTLHFSDRRDSRDGLQPLLETLESPHPPHRLPDHREEEARPSTGYSFEVNEVNMRRWDGWWKVANRAQLLTFVIIGFCRSSASPCLSPRSLAKETTEMQGASTSCRQR